VLKALVVVGSVLALLAGFAWFQDSCACTPRWRMHGMAIRSDLRNLVTMQEEARARDGRFADSLVDARWSPSTGVRIEITEATDSGWRAVATHDALVGECRIYVGKVAVRPMTTADTVPEEGQPACWGMWPREPSVRLRLRDGLGLEPRRVLPQDSVIVSAAPR